MSSFTGSIVPTFEEVYSNLQTLDDDKAEKSSIDQLIGIDTEDTMTAAKSHAVNRYLRVGLTNLYRVTSAISAGDTITVGTNVVAVTDLATDIGSRLATLEAQNVICLE